VLWSVDFYEQVHIIQLYTHSINRFTNNIEIN